MLFLILFLAIGASAQDISWVRQFGSAQLDRSRGVYTDGRATYVVGETTVAGVSQFHRDAFIRKLDGQGIAQWARTFGADPVPDGAIAVTGSGGAIYVVGFTGGQLPGQTSFGLLDAFLRKYDTDGQIVWTRQFGTNGNDAAWAVSADASGVYAAGFTAGVFPGQASAGSTDAFVVKFDFQGQQLWATQFGSGAIDQAYGIAADGAGGVTVVGVTSGNLGGANQGQSDAFVRRLNANSGAALWTRQFGTPTFDSASSVAADGNGIFVGGSTNGALTPAGNAGGYDGFIRRYDLAGSADWTKSIRTVTDDEVTGLALSGGALYATGNTESNLPGGKSAGLMDIFVRRYECDGGTDWTLQFGGAGNDSSRAISVRGGRIVVAGATDGALPSQLPLGQSDAFVVKVQE